jgi:hypothetical protein
LVTDPPYGINIGEHLGAKEKRPNMLRKRGGYIDTPEYYESVVVPAVNYCLRISDRAAVFGMPPSIWKLPAPDAIGGVFIPAGCGRSAWGFTTLSHCLLYGKAPALERGCKPIAISHNGIAEYAAHPTTKPLAWMRWLVGLVSLGGHCVLDAFMGSGTTGVACIQTGRRFVGIEIDKDYFNIAVKRIEAAIRDDAGRFAFAKAKAPDPQEKLFHA